MTIGVIESAQIKRAKLAKEALYNGGGPLPAARPPLESGRYSAATPCTPYCAWALAMRRDGRREQSRKSNLQTAQIIKMVCRHLGVNQRDVLSRRRSKNYVRARQIGMYLTKKYTALSLPEIGDKFGNRDHTTVLYAVRRVEGFMRACPDFRACVEDIEGKLHG